MVRAPTEIDADKLTIVRDLFIATADDNYITARWCHQHGLNIDFFWLAVHALEKYMKAALLLNDRSAIDYKSGSCKPKPFGHDLDALYAELGSITSGLLPDRFARPDIIDGSAWIDETIAEYMARLLAKGNADNRYMVFGYAFLPDQLAKLDQAIFGLRRLCHPLDTCMLGGTRPEVVSRRDLLARNPKWHDSHPGLPLETTMSGKRGAELRHVVLNFNFPFAPANYQHDATITLRSASHEPVLLRTIIEPLDTVGAPVERRQRAQELRKWALGNIKLPKDVQAQLKALHP